MKQTREATYEGSNRERETEGRRGKVKGKESEKVAMARVSKNL